MRIIDKTDLYFRQGVSDKVYHVKLVEINGNYQVDFAYGRRGSALNTGKKISGVTIQAARKVYDKLVQEKIGKGYQEMIGGKATSTMSVTDPTDTGFRPQLLNDINEDTIEAYINDPNWCAQEKYDGKRRGLIRNGASLIGANRKGLTVSIPDNLQSILPEGIYILDAEAIGDKVVIFDNVIPGLSFEERYKKLREEFVFDGVYAQLAPVAWTKEEKKALLQRLKDNNAEGIVFKRKDSKYTPGRPNSLGDQLKYKFCATASCIVTKVNQDKRSIMLAVHDGKGRVSVGNATVYPNQQIPKVNSIVEIKYLYYFPGGSLFQPVLLGERDDLDEKDCHISKLKIKREEEIEA